MKKSSIDHSMAKSTSALRRLVLILSSTALLSACGSIYLHDADLQTTSSKAHEALTPAARLKRFDEQLEILRNFANRKNGEGARFGAGERALRRARFVPFDGAHRRSLLEDSVNERLR